MVTNGSERVCKLYVRVASNPGLDLICITLLCDWKKKEINDKKKNKHKPDKEKMHDHEKFFFSV